MCIVCLALSNFFVGQIDTYILRGLNYLFSLSFVRDDRGCLRPTACSTAAITAAAVVVVVGAHGGALLYREAIGNE